MRSDVVTELREARLSYSVQMVAANLTRKAVLDLVAAVKATPDEKISWQPIGDVRPIRELLIDCSLANRAWTNILQTHAHSFLPDEDARAAYQETDSADKALASLQTTGDLVVEAILKVPDSDLEIVVQFPWSSDRGRPIADCCFHPFWNMSYHLGQVNYIQTLYQDWQEYGKIGPFGEL